MRCFRVLLISAVVAASAAACGQPGLDEVAAPKGPTEPSATASLPASGAGEPGSATSPMAATPVSSPASPNEGGLCGTADREIGYASHVQAVVAANCTICHGGSTAPKMVDFASTKAGFEGGGSAAIDSGRMPLGLTLSDADRCLLQAWAEGGFAR